MYDYSPCIAQPPKQGLLGLVYGIEVLYTRYLNRGIHFFEAGANNSAAPDVPFRLRAKPHLIVAESWRKLDLAKMLNQPASYYAYLLDEGID